MSRLKHNKYILRCLKKSGSLTKNRIRVYNNVLPPPRKKIAMRYVHVKTFSILTKFKFVENTCNIYISKYVYYENIFNDFI
jgi:hypothetical protein